MDKKTTLTNHAISRSKERLGLNKKSAAKDAEKAFAYGLTHGEVKGSFRRFLDSVYLSHRNANNIRVYHHAVYLFSGTGLITIISLPKEYQKLADKLQKAKNQ